MGKRIFFRLPTVLLLLVAKLSYSSVTKKNAYFDIGGELTLDPSFTGEITNVLWKLKGDLVAEWIKNQVELTYYGRFENRTMLDTGNGVLVLRNMTADDQELFTVEINNKVQSLSFTGVAIEKIKEKPEVIKQPLVCPTSGLCTLHCRGNEGNFGPITYAWYWKEGATDRKQTGQDLNITKAGTASVEEYSCEMINPVSNKRSPPVKNPFYDPPPPPKSNLLTVFVVLLVIAIIIVIIVVLVVKYWKEITEFIAKRRGTNPSNKKPNAGSPPEEGQPLDCKDGGSSNCNMG